MVNYFQNENECNNDRTVILFMIRIVKLSIANKITENKKLNREDC